MSDEEKLIQNANANTSAICSKCGATTKVHVICNCGPLCSSCAQTNAVFSGNVITGYKITCTTCSSTLKVNSKIATICNAPADTVIIVVLMLIIVEAVFGVWSFQLRIPEIGFAIDDVPGIFVLSAIFILLYLVIMLKIAKTTRQKLMVACLPFVSQIIGVAYGLIYGRIFIPPCAITHGIGIVIMMIAALPIYLIAILIILFPGYIMQKCSGSIIKPELALD